MRKLRLALGSNDGKEIIDSHMGEANYFYIYEIDEAGNYSLIDKRVNNTLQEKHHGDENKLKGTSAIFNDCSVVVARHKSPNFIRMSEKTRFQPVVIRKAQISDALEAFKEIFNTVYEYVERRNKGERFKEIVQVGHENKNK